MEFSITKCIDMYGEDLKKHYTTDFFFDRGIDFIENATEEGNGPFALEYHYYRDLLHQTFSRGSTFQVW